MIEDPTALLVRLHTEGRLAFKVPFARNELPLALVFLVLGGAMLASGVIAAATDGPVVNVVLGLTLGGLVIALAAATIWRGLNARVVVTPQSIELPRRTIPWSRVRAVEDRGRGAMLVVDGRRPLVHVPRVDVDRRVFADFLEAVRARAAAPEGP
ncbi:MAG: hypothetical protein Q4G64_09140 [bacterium]|nr:hypothetical protein [bacterium]